VPPLPRSLTTLDHRLTAAMARHGLTLLRLSLALVFLWFGVLKFFPGASPASELASRTIATVTGGLVAGRPALVLLASLETAIGLGLLLGRPLRLILGLLWLQMAGAMLPVVLFPGDVFQHAPLVPTLEGQYIIKNLVVISASLVLGATVRGRTPPARRE
jgi:uncharacterized membrane protein YkgB